MAFAAIPEGLDREYSGPKAGFVLVRGEFNHTGESIDPLWDSHITKISMMIGAKDLGSAPFAVEGGRGYEAEIVMPKSQNKRLWAGILSYGLTILHLMAEHPLDQKDSFEPIGSEIIKSLRFIRQIPDMDITENNMPLPSNVEPSDPNNLLPALDDLQLWEAYTSPSGIGSLQAFYTRELPRYGWEIAEFYPFPSQADIPYARIYLTRGKERVILAILPGPVENGPTGIMIKSLPR